MFLVNDLDYECTMLWINYKRRVWANANWYQLAFCEFPHRIQGNAGATVWRAVHFTNWLLSCIERTTNVLLMKVESGEGKKRTALAFSPVAVRSLVGEMLCSGVWFYNWSTVWPRCRLLLFGNIGRGTQMMNKGTKMCETGLHYK